MSLDWRFTDAERFAKLTDEEKSFNDTFIWGMMAVGLGEITEKNAEEWAWRYAYAVRLNGAFYYVDDKIYIPTVEQVRKRIGLSTNNHPNKTRRQFIAMQARIAERK